MKTLFKINTKDIIGEDEQYQAYGITAEQDLLTVTVNDVTTEFTKATEYVDRLKADNVSPENLQDAIADYINRDAALLI